MRWIDPVWLRLRLWWCRVTRQHDPIRGFDGGELFERCFACRLRSPGIPTRRQVTE